MRRLLVALIALAGVGVAPTGASAARTHVFPEAEADTADGYEVYVYGYRNAVFVGADGDHGGFSYGVRGVATGRRMVADFGELGHLDLTFEPRGRPKPLHLPAVCHGRYERQPGTWTGTLSFHAEDGSAAIEAGEVEGHQTIQRVRCDPPTGGGPAISPPPDRTRAVFLQASNSPNGYGATLSVTHREGARRARYYAGLTRRLGAVNAMAYTTLAAPSSTFVYDVRRETATVAPPPPFAGSATLGLAPDGTTTWGGDLTVDLAGPGVVPLTGGSFQASLATGAIYGGGGVSVISGRPAPHPPGLPAR